MYLSNLIRVVFLLVFVVLSGSAYAGHQPCCGCNLIPCPGAAANCRCCQCSDVSGLMCLKSLDEENFIATFTEGTTEGKEVVLPVQGSKMLETLRGMEKKCGLVKTGPQVVCTDFAVDTGTPNQQMMK